MSSETTYQQLLETTGLSGANFSYLEELYEQYLQDPSKVSENWRVYFHNLAANSSNKEYPLEPVREHFLELTKQTGRQVQSSSDEGLGLAQVKVIEYINAFRSLGHLIAKVDPLNLLPAITVPELELSFYNFSTGDMSRKIPTDISSLPNANLQEVEAFLRQTYADTITAEFMYISARDARLWMQEKMEKLQGKPSFSKEEKVRILQKLVEAEGLERYLGTKFVGQKRFSIEGSDSAIPMLDKIVDLAARNQIQELTLGMSHRGRLNVLLNINGKPAAELFDEFAGKHPKYGSGDVKYHKGYEATLKTQYGPLHMSMAYNPSHLEIVAPVIEGIVHAKQRRYSEDRTNKILPLILHGDASFEGQGVVMETLQLAKIQGYANGGTIHIILNNQIGFTTSLCDDRSTRYATDIAKMFEAPVLRVNGNDPEACVAAMQIAFDYRMKFQSDIFIDLLCYRRHGHNEADEPSGTQPLMYSIINQLPTPMALYAKKLEQEKIIDENVLKNMQEDYRKSLDAGKVKVEITDNAPTRITVDWKPYYQQNLSTVVETSVDKTLLEKIRKAFDLDVEQLKLQAQVKKVVSDRVKMLTGELPVDWGCAENFAYASLLMDGYDIRLSGQDTERGTFSHRHSVLHNMETGEAYLPLNHLSDKQGEFEIFNSILSEEAAMAFEYGYSIAAPKGLVIWEAQFGDFANGAQVVIDQFLSSGEQKWELLSGLALFLPHGQENMGPEHSSARLERYLQLCAEDNMQVCVPSTPAQMFHMIRRQVLRLTRKPLIVMTPKSLLRNKLTMSSLDDLMTGKFQLIIPEIDSLDEKKIDRVVLCSGKIYYELLQMRREKKLNNIAIIRVEQLYPFPVQELEAQLQPYSHAKNIIWCQEEPENQGSWYCLKHYLEEILLNGQQLHYAGRKSAAAPATGVPDYFKVSQEQLIHDALGITKENEG